jgi:N-acyl-D-amino-acid deacylase
MTLCSLVAADEAQSPQPIYEVVIRGGRIVDGTGAPWYVADLGISQGRIARIGRIPAEQGRQVIDATGCIVAPGFVDLMGQSASPLLNDPAAALNLLAQGITTINCGEGYSAAPLPPDEVVRHGYTSMREYLQLLDIKGLPVNVAQTVGLTQVRRIVIGEVDRRPTAEELERMRGLVREGMEAGAIGVSTALIYPPAVFADAEELAALAAVAGEYGGRYYTHIRNEGDRFLEALDEALEIGHRGQTPVHVFHLKAAGRQNWGKLPLAIARIQQARSQGQEVTADIYPYIHNGLGVAAFIHPRHFAEGYDRLIRRLDENLQAEIRKEMETTDGWENWFRHVGYDWDRVVVGQTHHTPYTELVGQTVAAIAREKQEDPWTTFFNLVKAGSFVLPQSMTEANLLLAMRQEFVSFCTDVGPVGEAGLASHPRSFGAFPRLLSRYVRDLGAISLERAVAQASAAGCNKVLAYDRGRLAEGLAADVIVFRYDEVQERATFAQPHTLAAGMQTVLVNGVPVYRDGKLAGPRPGRVLRGPGYRPELAPHRQATGELPAELAVFDRTVREFMQAHSLPGMSLAVVHQGQVALARGYGYADLATGEQVQPESLFRIASISKPITAVAILQLIERGQLQLDSKVLDLLDYSEVIQRTEGFDPRWKEITVRHLLEHRGGWDRDKSFDAMFQSVRFAREQGCPAPADPECVIRAMLGVPLDFDPGERYAYSNFGYCLLGRIIEQLTKQPYEQYVQEQVLAPLGITRMRIGRSRLAQRAEGEVRYYHPGDDSSVFAADLEQPVPSPYGGWYLEAMDAHGAWIASAIDLAKFAAAFDDPEHCPILSRSSIELMYARPPGAAGTNEDGSPRDVYYSLGWQNRDLGEGKFNQWHTGSLPGTATIMIRRHDGHHLVALMNCRVSPTAVHLTRDLDPLLHQAVRAVRTWPVKSAASGQ